MSTPPGWRLALSLLPLCLLLGLLMAACSDRSAVPIPVPSPAASTPAGQPESQPTRTPRPAATATATATARPTDIPRPTRTPRPTAPPAPTRTPTVTPYLTLEPAALRAFVTRMLETNAGCDLPCWWGITPGETRWEDAQAFAREQGIGLEGGELDLSYAEPERGARTAMAHVELQQGEEDGLVQGLRIRSDRRYDQIEGGFSQLWQRYALQPLLLRHGVPSQVYLNLAVGQGCLGMGVFPTYDLWVTYAEQGFAVRYAGMLVQDNTGWLACPVFGQTHDIEIRLWAPATGTPWPAADLEVVDEDLVVRGGLAELTGVTPAEFHAAFSQVEPPRCMEIADPSPWRDALALPDNPQALSLAAEDALLVDMLANNAGCELPCWWGITPGATSWEEAQRLFLSYGKSISSRATEDLGIEHRVDLFGRHTPYPFDYVVEHVLYEQEGTVGLIGIHGHTLGWPADSWTAPQHFTQDWERYTLDRVLARFGRPSQVYLHYWSDTRSFYSVIVLYEERGIAIEYVGLTPDERSVDYPQDVVRLCPSRENLTDINVWLKAPGAPYALIEDAVAGFEGRFYSLPPFLSIPTLEEATGMSLDTFLATFQDPATPVCLEAPAALGDYSP